MASAEDSLKVSRKTFLPEQIELRLDGLIKPKGGRQGKKRKSDPSAGTRVATPARKKYKAGGATSGPLAKGAATPTTPGSEKRKPGRPPKTKTADAKKAESTAERRRSGRATTKVKYVESGPSSEEEEEAYAGDDSGDEDVEMEDAASGDEAEKGKGSVKRLGKKPRAVSEEGEEGEEGEKERSVSPTAGRGAKETTEPMEEDHDKEKEDKPEEEEAVEPEKEAEKEAEKEEVAEKEIEPEVEPAVEPEEEPEKPPTPKPKVTPMKRGRGRPKRQPLPEPLSPGLPVVEKAKEKTPERKSTRGTRRTRASTGINGSATNGKANGKAKAKAKTIATGDDDSSELSEPPSDIEVS